MVLPLLIAAAALTGFTRAPILEAPAAYIAGKPAPVLCATDGLAWLNEKKRRGYSVATNVWGFTDFPTGTIYLHPNGCRILRRMAKGERPNEPLTLKAGFAVTLTHEAIHVRGERDEGVTECEAMHRVAGVLVRFFHVTPGKELRAYMAAAWTVHRTDPPPYQDVC